MEFLDVLSILPVLIKKKLPNWYICRIIVSSPVEISMPDPGLDDHAF